MVYYTQSELLTRGALPYRDTFMAHPPGVVIAFAPALVFERAWGGAAAFVAARQWLLIYSLLSILLVWLVATRIGGVWSGALASLVIALDGKAAFAPQSDRHLPNVGVLETLANLTSLGALALYVYAPEGKASRRWWLVLCGALGGLSALCKAPAIVLLVALLIYSILLRRMADASWLVLGSIIGAAIFAGPFFVATPGQMVRQALFFQLLRPQEVRAGIDQAGRIASYPEAQLTLLLAGLGIATCAFLLWQRAATDRDHIWVVPMLWAAPVLAVFTFSRSFHSQYYTQWVPPLALVASVLASSRLWRGAGRFQTALAVVVAVLAIPLAVSQWRVATSYASDEVYQSTGAVLASRARQGEQTMAFDPGYVFAAGLPPARIPASNLKKHQSDYAVDSTGFCVFFAEELDRLPWVEMVRKVVSGTRMQNEEDVLAQPEAQAALLSGAIGSDHVVLDQKIALPKLTAQSVRLVESLSRNRLDVGFATVLDTSHPPPVRLDPFPLDLTVSTLSILSADARPTTGTGTVQATSGDVLQLGLYLRPSDYLSSNMRVVVRLVDSAGGTARQVDTEPFEGSGYTSSWQPGYPYPDLRNITLEQLAAGEYLVFVRVYDPTSGASSKDVQLPQRLLLR
jgi:hypothetical protein